MTAFSEVTVADLPPTLPDEVAVLDVRQQEEWDAGHVAGSVHVPLSELPLRLSEVPTGPLLVVCRVGGRSQQASAWLAHQGYDATNLAGGLVDWHRAGRPLVGGDGSPGRVD